MHLIHQSTPFLALDSEVLLLSSLKLILEWRANHIGARSLCGHLYLQWSIGIPVMFDNIQGTVSLKTILVVGRAAHPVTSCQNRYSIV